MKSGAMIVFLLMLSATAVHCDEYAWYQGDARCPPPKDDGTYSAPYKALDHSGEYPMFPDADKPGWSCSYQREDGVIVQYGDSRTPQQQWMALWCDNNDN